MLKNEQKALLGYISFDDFLTTFLGLKNTIINIWLIFLLSFTSFITSYIWDSSAAIYTLLILMLGDWVLGVTLAVKASCLLRYQKATIPPDKLQSIINRRFSSSRFPRIFVAMPLALFVLSISWNLAKSNAVYYFLPSVVYGGFSGTYFVSLIENVSEFGLISKDIIIVIKERLNPVNWVKK